MKMIIIMMIMMMMMMMMNSKFMTSKYLLINVHCLSFFMLFNTLFMLFINYK